MVCNCAAWSKVYTDFNLISWFSWSETFVRFPSDLLGLYSPEVCAAVGKDGRALAHAAPNLKEDKEAPQNQQV